MSNLLSARLCMIAVYMNVSLLGYQCYDNIDEQIYFLLAKCSVFNTGCGKCMSVPAIMVMKRTPYKGVGSLCSG